MTAEISRRRALAAAAAIGLACMADARAQTAQPASSAPAEPLKVVASFSILADITREIAGESADVAALVGPDADAHAYAPSPADVKRVAGSNLIVVNGMRFEGWLDRLIAASGYRRQIVVAASGVKVRTLAGLPDPHAWQSLSNALIYVENIRAALSAALPSQRSAIDARAGSYANRIRALDLAAHRRFDALPAAHRRIITSHDAFGYFGVSYGIDFIAPQGRTTDSEASAADVARMIRQLRDTQARALFVENITDPRLIDRIAAEAKVKVGGTLYSDALSAPGSEADTYLKMMQHNIDAMAGALERGRP